MGKGSTRRPAQVSEAELEANWIKVFGVATREGAQDDGKRNEGQTLGQLGGDGETWPWPTQGSAEQTKPRC